MTKTALKQLIETYRAKGHIKGKELLLPLPLARHLLDDLKKMGGITVMGLVGWRYVRDGSAIVEDGSVDYFVGDNVMASPISDQLSIESVQAYLQDIPVAIDLISFTLDIPMSWIDELFSST